MLDEDFAAFLIHEHEMMNPEAKKNFLRILKLNPELAVQIILGNLDEWAIAAAMNLGSFEYDPSEKGAREVMELFQKHFARELAEITE